jgi:DMSO/TMAO reductase YedYZ molybdopterin-dependent catalytic subunit
MPESEAYARMMADGFDRWRLRIDGMVARAMTLSLADLMRLPARTQITRHGCVEGWSAIGKWQGVALGRLLDLAVLKPGARYVVFHCADEPEATLDGSGRPYESIDLGSLRSVPRGTGSCRRGALDVAFAWWRRNGEEPPVAKDWKWPSGLQSRNSTNVRSTLLGHPPGGGLMPRTRSFWNRSKS